MTLYMILGTKGIKGCEYVTVTPVLPSGPLEFCVLRQRGKNPRDSIIQGGQNTGCKITLVHQYV